MTQERKAWDVQGRLDGLRFPLGAVFLAAYAWSSFAPGSYGTAVFLGSGGFLYALSVPFASKFHKGLAAVAFAAFGALLLSGRFEAGAFFGELPDYFGIVAVLLVLSVAGYPIRAERFTAQIRALMAAAAKRGVGIKATAGVLGHFMGAVIDAGAFVLVDAIARRAAPKERFEALIWAGRAFTFVPLWTNLNVFTVTAIALTGVSYPALLAVTLPFAVPGLAVTLLLAQRAENERVESPEAPTREAVAVVLYPILLISTVALAASVLFPGLPLTAAIAVTVAVIVVLIAALATALLRRTSPARRLARETRESLVRSHGEFALFGSAGFLVLSLEGLGALDPVGSLLSALPTSLVALALALVVGVGFMAGIHAIPLVLLIDTAFPLSEGPSPALWAAAILLGAQAAFLLTPFSNTTTMLSRLTGLHPIDVGPKRNWRFGLAVELAGLLYLALLTLLLL